MQQFFGKVKNKNRRSLDFDDHVISLCKKAGKELAVLVRLSKFMSFNHKQILMKTFVESQFGYCPLIWMFHSKKINSKKIIYKNDL